MFDYDYVIEGVHEPILRIDASEVSAKTKAFRVVSEFIFKYMKKTFSNMTYIKFSILVPSSMSNEF